MLYAVSRIPTNNTPLSVYSTHTLYQTNTPLISSTTSRLEVPSRDFHKTQLPDSIGLSVTRVLTPIGYIALQFDSGGGAQQCFLSSSLVFVSRSRLSLVVCLGDDNASSSVVGARASASLVSSLSRRVCPLSHVKRERGRARSRRSPPRFVWLSLIQLRGPD